MIAEAIEKILSLAPPTLSVIDGRQYSSRQLHGIQPPIPSGVQVRTLTGFIELILEKVEALDDAANLIHVRAHNEVALIGRNCDGWGRRLNLITATAETLNGIEPDRFYSVEEFVIGLQSTFVETDDLLYVLGIASNLTSESSVHTADDGVSQRATVRTGVALRAETTVRARVNLRPYRTFREIEQPASDFIFRIRADGGAHKCALFEADGGKWKLDAVLAIQRYLDVAETAIPVVA